MSLRELAGSTVLVSCVVGCQPLPSIEYETDTLKLATDFDAPVCAGTLRMLDRAAGRITTLLDPQTQDDPFVVYWLEQSLQDQCNEDASGCFYPGTRVVFAHAESIAHEIVHATIDSPGEAFFVEEGLAEFFGGTGIRSDPSALTGRLAGQLRLSRRDYDHGRLSYPQAAHFTHWLREVEGRGALQRMAASLSRGDDRDGVRDQLEGIFGQSLSDIEAEYEDEADYYYPGIYDDDIVSITVEDSTRWLSIPLRCDNDETIGPLPSAIPSQGPNEGMLRWYRLVLPRTRELLFLAEGDSETRVDLLDPDAIESHPPWWPTRDHSGRLLRISSGERHSITLSAGSYLLAFTASGTAPAHIDLQIRPSG